MPTKTQSLFDRSAAKVFDLFGERDEHGELVPSVVLKIDADEYPLTAIFGEKRYEVVYSPAQNAELKSIRWSATVPTAEMTAHGLSQLPVRCEVVIADEVWSHDVAETTWEETYVTISLKRTVLSRLNTQERNGGAV